MKNKSFARTAGHLHVRGTVAVACAALLLLFTTPARAQEKRVLHGHVPPVVTGLQPLGRLPASTKMNLAIGLPLHNKEALNSLLQQIYDPASTDFHHYLTPKQFTERFGPTDDDYQAVIAFAKTNGLTVTKTHPNRVLLDVIGTAADIEKAFQVRMHVYQHPKENRTFFAPDVEPSVPSALPVLDISGLNNYILPHPKYRSKPAGATPNAFTGSGPGGTFMGNDFRNAYLPNVTLTGNGQAVGLLEFDGYLASDIALYEAQAGLPSVPLQNVLLDGFDGKPTGNGGEREVSLDIEMAISMAPGLSKVVVYEAGPNGVPNDALNEMVDPTHGEPLPNQLSGSWGWGGGPGTADQIFLQMAAQGQSFFNASGDSDAYTTGEVDDPSLDNTPSSSPYITQVGGTTLTTSGPGGIWFSETVWNWDVEYTPESNYDGVGSSGGISSYYPIPSWQQGINMTRNGGSTTFRNIPDVALTADNMYFIADNGTEYGDPYISPFMIYGGTSFAAPLWAGFTALVNQQATVSGSPVGFINPAIYAIGKGSSYTSCFHDITTGNNTWSGSPNLFYATNGYDLCTGWGTPVGQVLINDLAGQPVRTGYLQTSVNPPSGSALFTSTAQTVSVTVNDVYGVNNATVTGSISGITNLTFFNGPPPPPPNVYSALFQVPATANSVTMTVIATAPNEVGATNVVSYSFIPKPSNDNFANATKVPDGGAVYLSNNRLATMETGEPQHDGDPFVGASLWWIWTPTTTTNVLINTMGSLVDNVLVVYTGSTLTSLTQVAATNSNLTQYRPASFIFNAQAGTPYHIVVASMYSNVVGTVKLQIAPGGQPDTTPPTVSVTSPLSGLMVTNKVVNLVGTAFDPQPNATGVGEVLVTSSSGITTLASGTVNWTANVFLQPGLNTIQATAVDMAGNYSSPATIQLIYFVQNPPNDFFAEALPLTNKPSPVSMINTNATKEMGEPDHAGNKGGKSVWWYFTPPADGVLFLSTISSTFDTLLAMYVGSTVSNLTAIAANDDAYPGAPGGFSQITQAVRANQTYHIAVDGYDGASGTVYLTYSFTPETVYQLSVSNTVGGTVQLSISNAAVSLPAAVPPGASVVLTAIPNPYYQFDIWDGDAISLDNPLTLVIGGDMNLTAHFVPVYITDDFESGNLNHISWTTAGNAPWFVQTNVVCTGHYAARSGVITDSQTSSLILATNFWAGTGSFDVLVSSEQNFDFLNFYMDGSLVQQWSGEVGWITFSFPITTAGWHVLEWSYTKDPSVSDGLDGGFIDNVTLPINVGTNSSSPASLQLQRQVDGTFFLNVTGQTNQQYVVQSSTNLVDWQNISTNFATGGLFRFLDPSSTTVPFQFYRALVQ